MIRIDDVHRLPPKAKVVAVCFAQRNESPRRVASVRAQEAYDAVLSEGPKQDKLNDELDCDSWHVLKPNFARDAV